MFPDRVPVDAGWTAQGTHPAYSLLSGTFDHVLPSTRGSKSDPREPCHGLLALQLG